MTGAIIGATPQIKPTEALAFIKAIPSYKSTETALDNTAMEAAPIP